MEKIERIAKLLRDVGIIIGIPIIIVTAGNLYFAQISALKEQNEFLKQTQYDKALSVIEAQKKLTAHERQIMTSSISIISELMKNAQECSEHFNDDDIESYCSPDSYERDLQYVADALSEILVSVK